MIRSTRHITLVLVSCGLAALGFGLWEHDHSPATTQPSSSSHSWYSRSFGRSYSSGGHSVSSGTARGGFGSTGHAVSS